jgi:hypothetical protein
MQKKRLPDSACASDPARSAKCLRTKSAIQSNPGEAAIFFILLKLHQILLGETPMTTARERWKERHGERRMPECRYLHLAKTIASFCNETRKSNNIN